MVFHFCNQLLRVVFVHYVMMTIIFQCKGLTVSGRSCPFRTFTDFRRHNCTEETLSTSRSQNFRLYKGKLGQVWIDCNQLLQTRKCDTLVNTNILKQDLDKLFTQALCSPTAKA